MSHPQHTPQPRVRNAADRDQVKSAARLEARRAEEAKAALKTVLSTEAGRRVCWDLLTRAGVYQSIWVPTSEIHYRAGRHDFGLELLAALVDCDEDLYLEMEKEARARQRREANETDALHAARAEQGDRP